MIARWLRRRLLEDEARELEAEARHLRRSLAERLARRDPVLGLAALAGVLAVGYAEHRAKGQAGEPVLRGIRQGLLEGEEAKATELDARARKLREEAGR